jgi:hypothetical protein
MEFGRALLEPARESDTALGGCFKLASEARVCGANCSEIEIFFLKGDDLRCQSGLLILETGDTLGRLLLELCGGIKVDLERRESRSQRRH